ncbi:MAG: hypothetical protein IT456_16800 [Planctomycetes bacterium]|nr:hypothetical protein [Planctomycetota bacterium]
MTSGVRYSVTLSFKPPSPPVTARGEFTEDEWNLLTRFQVLDEELRTARLLTHDPPWQLSVGFDSYGQVASHNLPERIEIRELLHLLRPLILDSEPTAFYRIVNLLARHFTDDQFRRIFTAWRARFSGKDTQTSYRIEVGGLLINSERSLKLWLNAYEYHRDQDKQAILASLKDSGPFELVETMFVDLLTRQAEAISLAASFVARIAEAVSRRSPGSAG